jgi:hypothetical protein
MDEPATTPSPAPDDPGPASPPRGRWRELRRRIPNLLLLVAIAAVVLYTLHNRPVELEVSYELGSARRGLIAARMTYLAADGEEIRRVAFDYSKTSPGLVQKHPLQLLRGDHRVVIELDYRAGEVPPALARAERERTPAGELVRLRRPLHIRGKGEAVIYVVGD